MNRKQPINNYITKNITNEIDYDKLAQAIVNANSKSKELEGKKNKTGLLNSVIRIYNMVFNALIIIAALIAIGLMVISGDFCDKYIYQVVLGIVLAFLNVCLLLCSYKGDEEKNFKIFQCNTTLFVAVLTLGAFILTLHTLK